MVKPGTYNHSPGRQVIHDWMTAFGRSPFAFQEQAWQAYRSGQSGLVNAPTGYGKTFSLFLAVVIDWIDRHPADWQTSTKNGLQLFWVTPLRALAKDLQRAMQEVCDEISLPWEVALRTGDVSAKEKARQKRQMPEVVLITPESLHLLLAQKGHSAVVKNLQAVVVDEWHELLGSKRGVQVELALNRLRGYVPALRVWGISATIGNLEEAAAVLLPLQPEIRLIRASNLEKRIEVVSILPDTVERYPWAGQLGVKLLPKIIPILEASQTTLIFTNTRRQSELWYHALIDAYPEYAGLVALHHSSIDVETRQWVEEALHSGTLKAVICTSSLDLGIDFRPVETVIQVGSPKGVARFLQRAGRSGHSPGAVSRIYFLPTHSLELLESAALQEGIRTQTIEARTPLYNCYDVLLQYLVTLAVGEGFLPDQVFAEIKKTYAYQWLAQKDWEWCLQFITHGGASLGAYAEFQKVVVDEEDGRWKVKDKRTALRHRLHIGTIVSASTLRVRFLKGGFIGTVEETFIARLQPGDTFSLSGRVLEFVQLKNMEVYVRRSKAKDARVPSWSGGRLPMSGSLAGLLRHLYQVAANTPDYSPEIKAIQPIFALQRTLSAVPGEHDLLIEAITTRDGYHLFVYPFEGRFVHEVLASLLAFRLSRLEPITFSIAMNDYGFELLSVEKPLKLPENTLDWQQLFSLDNLLPDLQQAINAAEMAKRTFRNIASIGGLVFQGFPGNYKSNSHLQASSQLFFGVFSEYEPDNLLLQQAYREVFDQQMEEVRLRHAMQRILRGSIIFRNCTRLTPLSFPIKVDGMRESLSSEKLEDRVRRMQAQLARV